MKHKGKSVLIVENDPQLNTLLQNYLGDAGFEVIPVYDGEEAREKFIHYDPCFVITELMLPKYSGEQLCRWIRTEERSDVPLIIISVKDSEDERIRGLSMGADDYIIKPFSPREVVARVETVLRRTAHRCSKITYRSLTLKPLKREVKYKDQPIEVTNHEFNLLYFFMQHPNQILSRQQIIDHLYPDELETVTERTIDVHVSKIREKIELDEHSLQFISTIRGVGYRFEAF